MPEKLCLIPICISKFNILVYIKCFVCLILFFTSHQQSFSYKGTGLPGLSQYLAMINVFCSRTQRIDACEALTSNAISVSQARRVLKALMRLRLYTVSSQPASFANTKYNSNCTCK